MWDYDASNFICDEDNHETLGDYYDSDVLSICDTDMDDFEQPIEEDYDIIVANYYLIFSWRFLRIMENKICIVKFVQV